jgi:predicted Rossmann-fold nucleotide-binding protein
MRVAIIGSRKYSDMEQVKRYVEELPEETIVISGGAKGVDSMAEEVARQRGLEVVVIRPDYAAFPGRPRSAPIARNREIVRQADRVVAFWDGESRGTHNAIAFALQEGKAVVLFLLASSNYPPAPSLPPT